MGAINWLLALGVFGVALYTVQAATRPNDRVTFLDVGQGDSILIQNGTAQVLVDGGKGAVVLEQLARHMPWFDNVIDVLVVSHPQQDHTEGFVHILDRYDVGLVILPNAPSTTQLQEVWIGKLQQRGIPYRFAWEGQHISVADIDIDILHPIDSPEVVRRIAHNVNNASVTMRVVMHGVSFLLSGDAEWSIETMLAQHNAEALDAAVYKVGHHGSKTSSSQVFLNAITPAVAVVSVGADNRFGHPAQGVLDRLADNNIPVYRTDTDGAVTFLHEHGRWFVNTDKHGSKVAL